MDDSGALDLHQTEGITITIITTIFAHLTVDARQNRGPRDRAIGAIRSPEALSDGCEDTWKNSTIAVRSNRDRGTIEPRSWSNCCGINSTRARRDFHDMCSEIDAQSTHDQATIVVDRCRSRRKAWPVGNGIHGEIQANSWPISKRQRRPKESLSRPCKTAPTTASTAHDFGPISLFKNSCTPLFFNF